MPVPRHLPPPPLAAGFAIVSGRATHALYIYRLHRYIYTYILTTDYKEASASAAAAASAVLDL
jgi:hypothetical protein